MDLIDSNNYYVMIPSECILYMYVLIFLKLNVWNVS